MAANFCPNCGTKLGVGMKFCPSCGTNLSQQSGSPQQQNIRIGKLKIVYDGYWILWDVKIKLYVNDNYIAEHSFKQPFTEVVDITTYPLKLKVQQSIMKWCFDLPLDRSSDYTCLLTYDRSSRWFNVRVFDEDFNEVYSE